MTKTNRLFKALVYFYFISLCSSCLSPKDRAGTFLILTDSYQREIKLDKTPEKIISLSPGITEMIFLLRSEEKLIGISEYCTFPEKTKNIRKISRLQNINIETIISLKPDVVLIGSIISKNEVEKMEKSGINVIAIKEERELKGMLHALEWLGKITNQQQRADSLIQDYAKKLDAYSQQADNISMRPSVYYVINFGVGGDYTAPRNTHISEIIQLAGGKNIGDSLISWNISREYLFSQNPNFIFVRIEEFEHFIKTYPYTLLNAVKENRVFPIESGWLDVVAPRNFLAIEEMKEKINNFK